MTALIVPAFETQRYRIAFPKSKVNLIELLKKKEIFTFRYHLYTKAHSPTNYTKWQAANKTYQVYMNCKVTFTMVSNQFSYIYGSVCVISIGTY